MTQITVSIIIANPIFEMLPLHFSRNALAGMDWMGSGIVHNCLLVDGLQQYPDTLMIRDRRSDDRDVCVENVSTTGSYTFQWNEISGPWNGFVFGLE